METVKLSFESLWTKGLDILHSQRKVTTLHSREDPIMNEPHCVVCCLGSPESPNVGNFMSLFYKNFLISLFSERSKSDPSTTPDRLGWSRDKGNENWKGTVRDWTTGDSGDECSCNRWYNGIRGKTLTAEDMTNKGSLTFERFLLCRSRHNPSQDVSLSWLFVML